MSLLTGCHLLISKACRNRLRDADVHSTWDMRTWAWSPAKLTRSPSFPVQMPSGPKRRLLYALCSATVTELRQDRSSRYRRCHPRSRRFHIPSYCSTRLWQADFVSRFHPQHVVLLIPPGRRLLQGVCCLHVHARSCASAIFVQMWLNLCILISATQLVNAAPAQYCS